MSVLHQILVRKQREIERWKRRLDGSALTNPRQTLDVSAALRKQPGEPANVIAELKFRSPSAGTIRAHQDGDVVRIAKAYEAAGAKMVSVLADGPGFGGSIANVARVRKATALPILFKEFVLDEIQLDLARFAGADAVLLLVNALSAQQLSALVEGAHRRDLFALVEAANAEELEVALASNAPLVGVNARDLHTFSVDPGLADRLTANIPDDRVAITMSGVRDAERFAEVTRTRADAVLIGEGLMRAEDPYACLVSWKVTGGELDVR